MDGQGQGNLPNPNNPADPENLDGNGNPGAAQAAVAAGFVLPGQLVTLPVFNEERREGFVDWLEAIENIQRTYNWAPNALVQVAETKGGPKIAEWDRGKQLRGNVRNIWEGPGNFPESLMLRSGPKYTSATAMNAVSNLKQRSKKYCAGFHDQVGPSTSSISTMTRQTNAPLKTFELSQSGCYRIRHRRTKTFP